MKTNVVYFPTFGDRLQRHINEQNLLDGYARRHPTPDELRAQRQAHQREALNLQPPFLPRTPQDWPPRAA